MDATETKIMQIRAAAGNTCETCPTCAKDKYMPYRRMVDGVIVEGCIDACHRDYIYGASLGWHIRVEAREHRAMYLRHMRSL